MDVVNIWATTHHSLRVTAGEQELAGLLFISLSFYPLSLFFLLLSFPLPLSVIMPNPALTLLWSSFIYLLLLLLLSLFSA